MLLAACDASLGRRYHILGDSHHVYVASPLIFNCLVGDFAPDFDFSGGYVGLRLADPYLAQRVSNLVAAGRFETADRVLIFAGTNDVMCKMHPENCTGVGPPDFYSLIAALQAMVGPKLLLAGPSYHHEYSEEFYKVAASLSVETIDMRDYALGPDNAHLSPEGYFTLATHLCMRLRQ